MLALEVSDGLRDPSSTLARDALVAAIRVLAFARRVTGMVEVKVVCCNQLMGKILQCDGARATWFATVAVSALWGLVEVGIWSQILVLARRDAYVVLARTMLVL